MLEIAPYENVWHPDPMNLTPSDEVLSPQDNYGRDHLVILRETPYIDAYLIHVSCEPYFHHRFVFHEQYHWSYEEEELFEAYCLKNAGCGFSSIRLNRIYDYYSAHYPEWHLKRYHTNDMRMLDHIYHCFRKNSAKEMLYKAGLDALAAFIRDIDELNLLAAKPSDLYDGLTIKVLRAMNSEEGADLLSEKEYRQYLKQLNLYFPDLFSTKLNKAQCKYLKRLIDGGLVPGETGRLFRARKLDLMMIWNDCFYYYFLARENNMDEFRRISLLIGTIDPIYCEYFTSLKTNEACLASDYQALQYYLLSKREEFNHKMRLANRKRNEAWQERNHGYVVRYPQTINDFCREAIYMRNCLMAYADAVMSNDTTILFIREESHVNQPFITMEIDHNCLMQAYHRFNRDCTNQEASWIRDYCQRHGIRTGFHFDRERDRLF